MIFVPSEPKFVSVVVIMRWQFGKLVRRTGCFKSCSKFIASSAQMYEIRSWCSMSCFARTRKRFSHVRYNIERFICAVTFIWFLLSMPQHRRLILGDVQRKYGGMQSYLKMVTCCTHFLLGLDQTVKKEWSLIYRYGLKKGSCWLSVEVMGR